ncbi:hypothetical protein Pcinc_019428 [Petrolisthes cinctipes]|uniref:Uncharacterized protein n=1 Tax=Petrolisthes cinctipes TaxID=88211 RepID=A0AAE1FM59_PETCI|nr:hypothetical protein Pcinc_019428 [Petrolisthes cinctipes]
MESLYERLLEAQEEGKQKMVWRGGRQPLSSSTLYLQPSLLFRPNHPLHLSRPIQPSNPSSHLKPSHSHPHTFHSLIFSVTSSQHTFPAPSKPYLQPLKLSTPYLQPLQLSTPYLQPLAVPTPPARVAFTKGKCEVSIMKDLTPS